MKGQKIAIRIANPANVRRYFGDCAGDYASDLPTWWVGTVGELYPAASLPDGAKVISAPVRWDCGMGWVEHQRTRPKGKTPDVIRGGWTDSLSRGDAVRAWKAGRREYARRAVECPAFFFPPPRLP